MQRSEHDKRDAGSPGLIEALGVLRDAYRQVEAPFVFQPTEHEVGARRGWMIRRRVFTLATGALATAAGIVMAFTLAVEVPREQLRPTDAGTRSTPAPQVQALVAAAETDRAASSVEVSLAVPLWKASWSVPGMTPALKSKRGQSTTPERGLTRSPSLAGFGRRPWFKTPSLTLTPRRKSHAVNGTSYLDVRDFLPDYPAAGRPV